MTTQTVSKKTKASQTAQFLEVFIFLLTWKNETLISINMQLEENPVQVFKQIWAWKLRKMYADQNELPILVM